MLCRFAQAARRIVDSMSSSAHSAELHARQVAHLQVGDHFSVVCAVASLHTF
jgi:hypothetical protein